MSVSNAVHGYVAVGGGHDSVDCGPGRDTVEADPADRVNRNCERVRRG